MLSHCKYILISIHLHTIHIRVCTIASVHIYICVWQDIQYEFEVDNPKCNVTYTNLNAILLQIQFHSCTFTFMYNYFYVHLHTFMFMNSKWIQSELKAIHNVPIAYPNLNPIPLQKHLCLCAFTFVYMQQRHWIWTRSCQQCSNCMTGTLSFHLS